MGEDRADSVAGSHSGDPDRVERLKMWQGVIDRMARESASLKGWSVALLTGILLLARVVQDPDIVWAAVAPLLLFFVLDSYYLGLERGFRDGFCADRDGRAPELLALGNPGTAPSSAWPRFFSCLRRGASAPITVIFYGGLAISVLVVGLLFAATSPPAAPTQPIHGPTGNHR